MKKICFKFRVRTFHSLKKDQNCCTLLYCTVQRYILGEGEDHSLKVHVYVKEWEEQIRHTVTASQILFNVDQFLKVPSGQIISA
jgi:hypothetical protein